MRITRLLKTFSALPLLLILTSCQTRAAFNFGAYSEAERAYEKKEYRKAIEKYEAYLRENPEGNMAVISSYYMAKSHEALGEVEEAERIYEKIVKEHSDLIWADFSKSRLEELKQKGP